MNFFIKVFNNCQEAQSFESCEVYLLGLESGHLNY